MNNSRQINFFSVPDDIGEIATFLKDSNCIILKSKLEDPHDIFDYDIVANTESIFQVYLVKNDLRENLKFNYTSIKDYYFLELLKSNAIEFSLGGFYPYSNKVLHRSRLFYIYKYHENGALVNKDPLFVNWADEILKVLKKRFLKKALDYPQMLLTDKCLDWIDTNSPTIAKGGAKMVIK